MSKNVLQQCPKIFCNFVQKVLAKNKEVVLNRETFDSEAFKNKGGYNAVNKAFGQKLDEFIDEINGYMYSA